MLRVGNCETKILLSNRRLRRGVEFLFCSYAIEPCRMWYHWIWIPQGSLIPSHFRQCLSRIVNVRNRASSMLKTIWMELRFCLSECVQWGASRKCKWNKKITPENSKIVWFSTKPKLGGRKLHWVGRIKHVNNPMMDRLGCLCIGFRMFRV